MNTHRHGEQGSIPQRHERVFQKGSYWYYHTREGVDIGPFDTPDDATHGVVEFVDFICCAPPATLQMLHQCAGHA